MRAFDALVSLAEGVDRGLERWGLAPENRAYPPHVTIGRVRRPSSSATQEEVPFAGPLVDSAPEYTELARMEIDAIR